MHISDQKEELRHSMMERLKGLSETKRAAESRSLCRRLLPLIPKGSTVAAYMPLPTEPDIRPLLQELLDRGDRVFLPSFTGNSFEFRECVSLADVKTGSLNIPEPPTDAALLDPSSLSIALIPGRAFDRKGNRLGRGNGGYDVWLEKQRKANPQTQYWGLCFECQIMNSVPLEPHDQALDAVITARGKETAD